MPSVRQIGWMVAIWLASVSALDLVATILRLWLRA